jgi:hypothetical protein
MFVAGIVHTVPDSEDVDDTEPEMSTPTPTVCDAVLVLVLTSDPVVSGNLSVDSPSMMSFLQPASPPLQSLDIR